MKIRISKKLFLFATAILLGNHVLVNAAEPQNSYVEPLQATISDLEDGYLEYYNINDTSLSLLSSHEVDNNIENIYLYEMNVVLKADSVEEMDYYKGIADYYEAAEVALAQTRSTDSQLHINRLSNEKKAIQEELETYIGKEQTLTFFIKETYSIGNEAESKVLFENGVDYVSVEEMLPNSHEELRENGHARMSEIDSEYTLAKSARASYSYEKAEAVSYMLRYTSNPTGCNIHTNCAAQVDTTKYNPNYSYYVGYDSAGNPNHVDCANYISQALSEGGIPEDNTWKPGSSTWINVGNLTAYMTSNGYWSSVGYNVVQKGDILSYTSYSHVIMITSFDGVSYRYSGHTYDRNNATITIHSSSPYRYYRAG